MGALVGFLALFGFWEIWNGFAKKPITDLYDLKTAEFQRAAFSADPDSAGDIINSRYKALKWLVLSCINQSKEWDEKVGLDRDALSPSAVEHQHPLP
jgi:hypothetical protein